MFTGIVQGMAEIRAIEDADGLRRLTLAFPEGMLTGLERGASVAIGGVCLTAVAFDDTVCRFDIIRESLQLTTLGDLSLGDRVNFERSATFGSEIGGHLLSGHIAGMVEVVAVEHTANNVAIAMRVPEHLAGYVIAKGYVALDGCSLTVGEEGVRDGVFRVHLIPETLEITTLSERTVGDRINLEVDAMTRAVVDTVRTVLAAGSTGQ